MAIQDRQPEPAPTILRRGEKRKSERQLQKRTRPSQPVVVERFDISDQTDHLPPGADQTDHLPPGADQEPPPVTIDRGAVTTLAKHMAANRRRPTRTAEQSTAVAIRATTEQQSTQALSRNEESCQIGHPSSEGVEGQSFEGRPIGDRTKNYLCVNGGTLE